MRAPVDVAALRYVPQCDSGANSSLVQLITLASCIFTDAVQMNCKLVIAAFVMLAVAALAQQEGCCFPTTNQYGEIVSSASSDPYSQQLTAWAQTDGLLGLYYSKASSLILALYRNVALQLYRSIIGS